MIPIGRIDYLHGITEVVNELQRLALEGLALSMVSVAELYEGVYDSTSPSQNEKALTDFVSTFTVLGIDEDICKLFGRQRGRLRAIGKQSEIGDLDIFIASTCLHHGLTLLTNNVRHFKYFDGLKTLSV